MARYTVLEVSNEVRDWMAQGKFPMKEYRVNLQPPDGVTPIVNVEWSRKAESPAPTPGQVIEVDRLEDRGPRGLKLHLANPQGGGSEDPKRAARIGRMHSQEMALRALELAFGLGMVETPQDSAGMFALIAKTADWFDADARRAGDNA